MNSTDWSPTRSVPCTRYGSPPGGTSSLITSAPSAASVAVACEPATNRVRSSTRSPSSGALTTGPAPGTRRRRSRKTSDSSPTVAPARAATISDGITLPPSRATASTAATASACACGSRAATRAAVRSICRSTMPSSIRNSSGAGASEPCLVDVHVHAHLRPGALREVALRAVRRLGDPALREPLLDGGHRAAGRLDLGEDRAGRRLDVVGEPLDEERAGERVGGAGDAGLERDDLLRAQRERHRLLGRDLERLVVAHHVDRLRAAQHGAQALQRRAHDVVERLLRGERRAGVPREEPQAPRTRILRAEPFGRDPEPHAAGGAQLRHLLEQIERRGEVEGQPRRERVEVHPARDQRLRVRDGRRQREPELLHGVAPGLARVVPGDRDRG